ncbi:MDR family NADP-dependent oxidoreductase [Aspergillus stella-maris]|uniref:MDR family NADP-dependent oxidoreductase n=1 Tax=Aspergillus stella-maris TaxID=1810926 RepID=UPI003CCE0B3B
MPSTRQWLLNSKPTDMPTVTGSNPTFKLTTADIPAPTASQALVKTLMLSNDPAQRTWIVPDADPERLYAPPVEEGTPMASFALAEVVQSGNEKELAVGSLVLAPTKWSELSIHEIKGLQVVKPIEGLDLGHFLGAFGLTGLTAYYGIKEVAGAGKDDTVVVSGAAGATGSMVVQIAKKILGCKRVIGIAGTDDKCRWVEKLGADVCINYKKDSFKEDLTKATEGFVEVYFDNVGGDMLDFMLTRMKRYGRIAACGAISNYNTTDPVGIKNFFEIVSMRIQVRGFIVLDYIHKFGDVVAELSQAWQQGKIVVDESMQTVVEAKFEEVPNVWMKLFEGANTGKLCTKIVQ